MKSRSDTLLIIPAYNEEAAIGSLVDEVRSAVKDMDIAIINDGSDDLTAEVAGTKGVIVLDLPCNLGVGGAVQTGFKYAYREGYKYVVRIDGDGQHPPSEIPKLLSELKKNNHDLVIGTRFGANNEIVSTVFRYAGIKALALFLSFICRTRVTDPTSGFWAMNRGILSLFSRCYPIDYPEPEAIALLHRQGYTMTEVPVAFRLRKTGKSSIRSWYTIYFTLKVGLALVIDRIRPVNRMYAKYSQEGKPE